MAADWDQHCSQGLARLTHLLSEALSAHVKSPTPSANALSKARKIHTTFCNVSYVPYGSTMSLTG